MRRLADCYDLDEAGPSRGAEVAYLRYNLSSPGDLQRMLAGEDVTLELEGDRDLRE